MPIPIASPKEGRVTTPSPSLLDHAKLAPPINVCRLSRTVARTTGKSLLAQRREIFRLNLSIGMITPDEYYYYRLYDDQMFSPADKRRFLGIAAQRRILRHCTNRTWWGIVHDKLVFQAVLQAHGISMPRIAATYHGTRAFPGATVLRTTADVVRFLRECASYPLFGKPFDGMYSVGSVRLDGYDAGTDRVHLHTGSAVPVETLVEELAHYGSRGYLFQQVKHPDARMRAICGDRLACVRVVILLDAERPEIFRALWKIPTGFHVADNFWRQGNMLGAIDIANGSIIRVVTGVGPDLRETDRHPNSGAVIVGTTVPQWEAVKTLCLTAASLFPGLTMQAWDIGVCPEGPVVIEANVGGDFNLPQLATNAGLLDERFATFLAVRHYAARRKLLSAAHAFAPRSLLRLAGAVRRRYA
jgi:hypothetical protein